MTINSFEQSEDKGELNGHTLILKMRQTMLRMEP